MVYHFKMISYGITLQRMLQASELPPCHLGFIFFTGAFSSLHSLLLCFSRSICLFLSLLVYLSFFLFCPLFLSSSHYLSCSFVLCLYFSTSLSSSYYDYICYTESLTLPLSPLYLSCSAFSLLIM